VLVVAVVVGSGVAVGLAAHAVARRWPRVGAAPRVAPTTIADQVEAHPAVADALADAEAPAAPVAGVALSAAVVGIVIAVVAFGLVAMMVDTNTGLARWDATFAQFGADHASERSSGVLRAVSLVGGWGGVVSVVVVVGVFAAPALWGVAG
jgi:hypothetical protein